MRNYVFKKAREMVQKQTRGNYPAPNKIIDCVETGFNSGMKAGLAGEFCVTLEKLVHVISQRNQRTSENWE